jgi:hypothetical protein
MQVLGGFVAGTVGVAVVYYTGYRGGSSSVNTATAGLALLYSLGFCDSLTFLARSHADVSISSPYKFIASPLT